MNELINFSGYSDDSKPNSIAFQNGKDMFVLSGFHDFSPSKRLAHNALNLNRKLLHYQLVKTIHPKGFSQELVIDVQLILMWKIASHKSVDCASSIFSHIRYCSSSIQNIALPYMLIYFL